MDSHSIQGEELWVGTLLWPGEVGSGLLSHHMALGERLDPAPCECMQGFWLQMYARWEVQ